MKITIEITEPHLSVLSKWASVGRTLRTAQAACDSSEDETFNHCSNELEVIIPALDYLHYTARAEIWRISQQEKALKELKIVTPEDRIRAIEIMKSVSNPLYYDNINKIIETLKVSKGINPEAVIEWLKT